MTDQIPDRIELAQQNYVLLGTTGHPPFTPDALGLQGSSASTACRRGYVCNYAVLQDTLVLRSLTLGCPTNPTISVDLAKQDLSLAAGQRDPAGPTIRYDHVNLRLFYSGSLLVGCGYISALDYLSVHPAIAYRTVSELTFENGTMTINVDRSSKLESARDKIPPVRLIPVPEEDEPFARAIADCFAFAYRPWPGP